MPGYDPGPDFTVGSLFGVMRGTYEHNGVDFPAPQGTPIPCAAQGVVVGRGTHGMYGNMAIVKHDDPTTSYDEYTLYAHMPGVCSIPSIGTPLARGQAVGVVGSTGNSTDPHLHIELIWQYAGTWWTVDDPWEGGAIGLVSTEWRLDPLDPYNWRGLDVYQGAGAPSVAAPPSSCAPPCLIGCGGSTGGPI